MEQKRELTPEEMGKVSGGNGFPDNGSFGTCPSCGMPVAVGSGIISAECPHCHKPIPMRLIRIPMRI